MGLLDDARWSYEQALRELSHLAIREANRTGAGNPPAGVSCPFRNAEGSLEEHWERVNQAWETLERLLALEED